jgi:ubiquinone biosynthesis accessory factor UbiJ
MLKHYFLHTLQTVLNYALNLDESTPDKLQELSGSVIEMVISPLNFNFFISFQDASIQLCAESPNAADTVIYSSPIGLLNLSLTPASKIRSLFNDQIKITGNLELGQKVKKFMDELDLDIEGQVAKVTGDVVAYKLGSILRNGIEKQQQVTSSVCENISEFMQEECLIVPSAEELNDFLHDVDELNLRAERLLELFKTIELKL